MRAQEVAPVTSAPSAWLQALGSPLQSHPCGEDPRYLDDFLLIKQEIDRVQGNDYARVVQVARPLLAERSRDLRVAGYLLLAAAYVEGLPGLLEAARGYLLLLERYGRDCHPHKEAARVAALAWLNHTKLDSYARQQAEAANQAHLEELRQVIDGVNHWALTHLGEAAPRWTVLDKWLQKRLSPLPPPQEESPKVAPLLREVTRAAEPPRQVAPQPPLPDGNRPGSERELVQWTRMIRDYLLASGDDCRAVAYTRSLRWAALSLPPHQDGTTRIPAPRAAARNELQQLLTAGQPRALFLLCEKLFLEPGGHLDLDLQRHAWQAARQMEQPELARLIAEQTTALTRRLPELPNLRFEAGEPFADSSTRQWLAGLAPAAPPAQAAQAASRSQGPATGHLTEQLAAARALMQSQQLPAALGLLKTCLADNDKQRLELQLAMASLCLEAGRPEVAQPVLDELQAWVEEKSLHLWDQQLALQVWTLSLESTRALLQRTPAQERGALSEKMAELQSRICRIDLEAAARLF